ncbi:hypothetical protein G9A89_018934 [Geosiphon pyriformis]|nr:hypothetical protein G9A89_018934 [Geosiphon pyriformis]
MDEALPSIFFQTSEPTYVTKDSPNSQEGSSLMGDDPFLLDSWEESENDIISEEEKWKMEHGWLKKFYKNQPIPLFERNTATASALHQLALLNMQQDAMAKILLENQKIHALEYRAESERIKKNLNAIGIKKEDLSKNSQTALRTLATLGVTLGLGDVERSSYLGALAKLNIDLSRAERRHAIANETASIIENRTREAKIQNEKIRRVLSNSRRNWDLIEEQKLREWKKNTTLLTQKGREYQDRLTRLETQYSSMNIEDSGVRLDKLKQKEDYVTATEEEVRIKNRKLRTYQNMPPDITLATFQLHEAKERLAELEIKRQELLSNIAENVQ